MMNNLKTEGVIVSLGQSYQGPKAEKGWARIGFAVQRPVLEEAIRRISDGNGLDCILDWIG